MQVFETFQSLNDSYPEIHDQISQFASADDYPGQPLSWVFGGDVYVVETEEEYREMLEEHQFFDIAELVIDGKWFNFFIANNNAGGPSYYVPPSFVKTTDYEGKL